MNQAANRGGPQRDFPQSRVYIGWMTDQWNEKLRCPKCSKTGMTSLSQAEGDRIATVLTMPVGFTIVQTEFGPDFRCATCGTAVDP